MWVFGALSFGVLFFLFLVVFNNLKMKQEEKRCFKILKKQEFGLDWIEFELRLN